MAKPAAAWLSTVILGLASALGLWAFISPFFGGGSQASSNMGMAHSDDAPLIFVLLFGLCMVVVVANLETRQMDARLAAVLGVLVAINATLRLIPGPAGFSAVFFLPILCGYVFGADFGFLLGALSLAVSALLTSGIGPWLPFQMFAAGWTGMAAGWLPHPPETGAGWARRIELGLLGGWGIVSGLLFGIVMNLWFWPYLAAPPGGDLGQAATTWQPGAGLASALARYGLFYVTTSLWWDAARALGNLLFLVLLGAPVLKLLRRFRDRFHFVVQ